MAIFSKLLRRGAGVFLGAVMAISGLSAGNVSDFNNVYSAGSQWHFDFGALENSSGYTQVSASTEYSSSLGYGFANTSGVKDVLAAGSDVLSDAVQFTSTDPSNTFNVDLPNGLYRIGVTLGYTNRTSIRAEGMLQIINMTGDNAYDSILIPITDGQLNIMATAGKAGNAFTISALDIEKVYDSPNLPSTIWICGDSTVCNYYPKDTSVQAGWGQVLDQYVDSSWQIRNMAASGQYAKGFVDAGQFEPIKTYGKEGDIYIISIGINDTNYSNAEEYTQVVTDMVTQAKAKGMKVVLVKQQGRATDQTNNPGLTGRWFSAQLEQIGAAQNVQVIDLFNPFLDYCKSIGQEATYNLYMSGDTLHPNRQGAMKLAEIAASQIDFSGSEPVSEGAVIDESITFMLKNGNSGKYMSIEGTPGNGANVVQLPATDINSKNALWRAVSAGDGYYKIYSCQKSGTYLLDVVNGNPEIGTNIGIWGDTQSDAQSFKFIQQDNGSYIIATKSSKDSCAVEVINGSNDSGANVQQWERNGYDCQTWYIETTVDSAEDVMLGDVNGDGVVNSIDTVLIRRISQGGVSDRAKKRSADVNADTKINEEDCEIMTRFITGKGDISPVKNGNRVYYAVDQAYNSGIEESYNGGFASDAYLNLDNKSGSFVEWYVTVPAEGNYLCTWLVANGSANDRQMKIEVNNGSDYWIQPFLTTSSWTTWEERGIVLPLKQGRNIIRMTSATNEGGPNMDYMRLELTDEPIAEVFVPEENPSDTGSEGVTIYLAGDSTVQTYRASYAPQQGWGAYLGNYFDESISVSNHAIAGRSSKSFYDNGRLDTILNEIKSGDYLFIQFGINDSAYNNAERYAPTCGTVPGTLGSYEYYMAFYIEGALNKGATPVIISPTLSLKNYSNGQFTPSYTNYTASVKLLAEYYNVPYIDLNGLMVNHYNAVGYDAAYAYHMCSTGSTDMTHFTETGANAVAKLIADSVKTMNLGISSKVK